MWGDARSLVVPGAFVIPGEGALAPQTRNKAARESANLSQGGWLKDFVSTLLRRRPVPGFRFAPPGMTKEEKCPV